MDTKDTQNSGRGWLKVQALTAYGAIPVSDALVLITSYKGGAESGNGITDDVIYALTTGADGLTDKVELETVPAGRTDAPSEELTFAKYNISTSASGYNTVRNIGVPIYPGITSIQPVILIPAEGAPSKEITYNESAGPNL